MADSAITMESALKAAKDLATALGITDVSIQAIAKRMVELKVGAQSAYDSLKAGAINFLETNMALGKSFDDLKKRLGGVGSSFMDFTSGTASNFIKSIDKIAGASLLLGTGFGRSMIDPIAKSGDALASLDPNLKAINDSFRRLLEVQNVARTGFMMMGKSIAESDAAATKYPQTLRVMQSLLGLAANELNEVNKIAKIVPYALDETAGSLTGVDAMAGKMVQSSAVAATVLKAFGVEGAAAGKALADGWYNFNQTTNDTIKQSGLLAAASKATGVDLGMARQQIEDAGKNLGIFGQKSSAAANIWTSFTNTLRGSGVPIADIGKMVTDLTGKFANMELNTKAFLSTMSGMGGGKSAIGGALQFEMNMRAPGGLEKNLQMLTSTLGQVAGGKIITLQEAASNPQLEAQFIVQRNMLQKMGGIQTTEQANRVMEAMQGVQRGTVSQLQGGQALQDVFNKGRAAQENTLTGLDKLEITVRPGIQALTNIDDQMSELNKNFINGSRSRAELEKGARGGFAPLGDAWANTRTRSAMGKSISSMAIPGMGPAMSEAMKSSMRTLDALTHGAMNRIEPRGGAWNSLGRVISGARGREHPIETTMPSQKELHHIVGQISDSIKPLTSPLHKVVQTLQEKDTTKIKLLGDILSTLNQKPISQVIVPEEKATESRKTTISKEETNSTITIKIESQEDIIKNIAAKAMGELAARMASAGRSEVFYK